MRFLARLECMVFLKLLPVFKTSYKHFLKPSFGCKCDSETVVNQQKKNLTLENSLSVSLEN
jgi:hypothetical protein